MANTKISALPAVSAALGAQEFVVNDAGTSRKVTATQLADLFIKRLSGSSGTAGDFITTQVLTANASTNSTVTLTTVMTTSSLPAGVWLYAYYIVWQSASTTVGINFAVDSTATVTRVRSTRHGQTTLATAADGIADGIVQSLTGGCVQNWGVRSDAGSLGPNTGVDTANADQFEHIRGLMVTSTSGDLLLQAATETAATNIQVMADTALILTRLA